MSAHTPGPWVAYVTKDPQSGLSAFEVYTDDGRGNGDHIRCTPGDAESAANARVLGAAPTMLLALRDVASHFDSLRDADGYSEPTWLVSVRAAIAMAEGK